MNTMVTASDDRNDVERELSEPLLLVTEPSLLPEEEEVSVAPLRVVPSRNVKLTLLYTFFAFAGRSIWSQSVLAAYVYLLRNDSPEAVGYITAVMGLAQLICSFPTGIVADCYRRDSLLRAASFTGCIAVVFTLVALRHESYLYLVASLASWGCVYGIANTSMSALFADSIPEGRRSYYFTQRTILVTMGTTAGPCTALGMFLFLGDHWTVKECAIVMAAGQIVCFPAVVILCFFSDEAALHVRDDEEEEVVDTLGGIEVNECESNGLLRENCQSEATFTGSSSCSSEEGDDGSREDEESTVAVGPVSCCLPPHRVIPMRIALSDLIAGLGSGMSIRYFPIFFLDNLQLGPVRMQVLFMLFPLLQSLLMRTSQRLAQRYGRCHVSVAFRWIGIVLMFLMITAYMFHCRRWVVCTLYVLRTAFMNSTGALTRSFLMDTVPAKERGKWSALESVNMFSWSGSAIVGGVLVGTIGIVPLFAITAAIQFISSTILITLFRVDKVEEPQETPSPNEREWERR
jgi:MFS family permease